MTTILLSFNLPTDGQIDGTGSEWGSKNFLLFVPDNFIYSIIVRQNQNIQVPGIFMSDIYQHNFNFQIHVPFLRIAQSKIYDNSPYK